VCVYASCRLVNLSSEAVSADKRQQNRKFLRKITRDGVNTAYQNCNMNEI